MNDLRFGIIGTGSAAGLHAQAIRAMAGGCLHSIWGPREDAARELAAAHGAKAFGNFEEFLGDSDLDIVTVATPTGTHLEPALAAARAGKHVVVERPLEITVERADCLIAGCREAGVVLAGILNCRFRPASEAFKTAVIEGRFGTLALASASLRMGNGRTGQEWRKTAELAGGGAFLSQGIDVIDLLLFLAGDVKSVWASTACMTQANGELEDAGVAMVEFCSGTRGVIQCATCCWPGRGPGEEVQLWGESGSACLVDGRFRRWEFQDHAPMDHDVRSTLMLAGEDAVRQGAEWGDHQRNLEDVVRAIREGREPAVTGAEARRALALIGAIYLSAREGGRRVHLD